MSAKKKYKKKPQGGARPAAAPAQVKQPPVELSQQNSQLNIILPAIIAVITFIVYRYTVHNQFLDWDDWIYVQKDPFITSFSWYNIKMMLFHNITRNYFHPITMLSLAFNYHFSKLDPESYYVTNILIHCANTIVIYFFTKILLENMSQKYGYGKIPFIPWLAAASGLFLGVHPMHVESVAWMCERKDVLYAFFYFLGLIAYLRYINDPNFKWGFWVVAMYGCSLLSKPMAVSFPLTLFAVDILLKKDKGQQKLLPDFLWFSALSATIAGIVGILLLVKLIYNPYVDVFLFIIAMGAWFIYLKVIWKKGTSVMFIEKFPLILVSIAGGVVTFYTQKESGSIAFLHGFTFFHKLMVPFYSFSMYFIKALVPFKLSSYYPYPPVTRSGQLPLYMYLSAFIAIAIVGIPLYLAKKGGEKYLRVVLFGYGFYFANVVFILQFLSSGVAIMAERYSYVAYFGIFFMVAYFLGVLIQKMPAYKVTAVAITGAYILSLAYVCDARTKSWHDSETFWHDVIKKYPRQWMVPYMNLGQYYVDKGQMDSAFSNYSILVQLHSTTSVVYRNLANIYAMHKNYEKSLQLYTEALKYDSTGGGDIYLDRAVTLSIMGRLDSAIADYNHAYQYDSNSTQILGNRAYAYLATKQYNKAITDYNHLLRISKPDPTIYLRKGICELNIGHVQDALKDFNQCTGMQPNNGECLYDMSIAYNEIKDYNNALDCAIKARQAGYKVDDAYISGLQKNAGKGTPRR